MYNPEIEAMSRTELEALQFLRLKQTISKVYENVASRIVAMSFCEPRSWHETLSS